MQMPKLKDVADLANVSITAASVVLSDTAHKRGISKSTQERIYKAADQLKFRANRNARALRTGKTQVVGIVGIHLTRPIPRMILSAVSENLAAINYNIYPIDFAWTRPYRKNTMKPEVTVDINQLDGLIILDMADINIYHWIEKEVANKIPIIGIEDWGLANADIITVDREEGAYQAVKHLLGLGHKKIALTVDPLSTQRVIKARVKGYMRAYSEFNIPTLESLFVGASDIFPIYESGIKVAQKIISHTDKPTAIFALNDEMAIGILQYFYEKKVYVPDDIAIVGFDGMEESAYACVPLTTVAQPVKSLAQKLVELMITRINKQNDDQNRQKIILKPNLLVRKSCGSYLQNKDDSIVLK